MTPAPATDTPEGSQPPQSALGEALLDALRALAEVDAEFVTSLECDQHARRDMQGRDGL